MSQSRVEELVAQNIAHAKARMEEDDCIMPIVTIYAENQIIPIGMAFDDEDKKVGMLRLAQLFMLKYKAYAYTFVYEAFMAHAKDEAEFDKMNKTGQVKDMPNAVEVVLCSYISHDVNVTHSVEVKRDKDGKIIGWGEPQKAEDMGGRFTQLLPPRQVLEKEQTQEQKDTLEVLIQMVCMRYGFDTVQVDLKGRKDGGQEENEKRP